MKLYKFRSLKNIQYVLDIIILERLHCASFYELNDPCEGLFFDDSYIGVPNESSFIYYKPTRKRERSLRDTDTDTANLKICSLSETLSDIRLWSYYADSHGGVAVKIDFSGKEEEVKKVNYFSFLLEHTVRPSLLGATSTPKDVLSSKTIHWEYEKEYRIIQHSEYYSVSGRVTAVYAGINSKIYYDILKKIVPLSIMLFKTKLNPHNLEIETDGIITR